VNDLITLLSSFFHPFSGRPTIQIKHSLSNDHSPAMQTTVHATHDPTQPGFFLVIRSIVFSLIMFLCFLWIILLTVALFAQLDVMNHIERSLIFVTLGVDSITIILLPILLLWPFRLWLDAARFGLLIILHSGIAGLFTYKSHEFQCSSAQSVATCNFIVLYIIVASWLLAACIIGYACGLAVLSWRLSRAPLAPLADLESFKQSPPCSQNW